MKSIKSIDEYSEVMDKITSIKNGEYYNPLSDDERTKLADDLVEMNRETIDVLTKKFTNLQYRNIEQDAEWCLSAKNDWVNVYVYSCRDEWFVVIAYGYYKCDQIDGVLHLLDDIQKCIE